MRFTGLGKTASYCYSVITVVSSRLHPIHQVGGIGGRGRFKKMPEIQSEQTYYAAQENFYQFDEIGAIALTVFEKSEQFLDNWMMAAAAGFVQSCLAGLEIPKKISKKFHQADQFA